MDAIVALLVAYFNDPNAKWVDDLAQFRCPVSGTDPHSWRYAFDLADIFALARRLGIPWKLGKCFAFAFLLTYLGFLWDLRHRTVSLPDDKRRKYLQKVTAFLAASKKGRITQNDAMSLNGTLSHITFVFPRGRAYLTNLAAFTSSFPHKFATRYPPRSLQSDLLWWADQLSVPGAYRTLSPRVALTHSIWVDASTSWGIGIMIDGRWSAWRWAPDWKSGWRDIGWAEMIAVELAALILDQLKIANGDLTIHSDNAGVVGAFNRGRSRNFEVNLSIRRTTVVNAATNVHLLLQYVNTKDNIADPISRGCLGRNCDRLPLIQLPSELLPFLLVI